MSAWPFYLDLYIIHTPFAFQPGDVQDPRDVNGNVIYDTEVKLLDTWGAVEKLVDEGKCKAIGLSDVGVEGVKEIYEGATIKPQVVHVESHPYLPEWELLQYCQTNGIVLQAFAALGHSSEPNLLADPVITAIRFTDLLLGPVTFRSVERAKPRLQCGLGRILGSDGVGYQRPKTERRDRASPIA